MGVRFGCQEIMPSAAHLERSDHALRGKPSGQTLEGAAHLKASEKGTVVCLLLFGKVKHQKTNNNNGLLKPTHHGVQPPVF